MPSPVASWDCFFSLPVYDPRFFVLDRDGFIDRLSPELIDWLEMFVGKSRKATLNSVSGDGWHYEESGAIDKYDANLAFEDPKHAAMFKLIYGCNLG